MALPTDSGTDMHSFLQLSRPAVVSSKAQLSLPDLIPESELPSTADDSVPIKLKHLVFDPRLPAELFLPDGSTETAVEEELNQGSCAFHVYATGFQHTMITVPFDWSALDNLTYYVYCPHPDSDAADVLIHSAKTAHLACTSARTVADALNSKHLPQR